MLDVAGHHDSAPFWETMMRKTLITTLLAAASLAGCTSQDNRDYSDREPNSPSLSFTAEPNSYSGTTSATPAARLDQPSPATPGFDTTAAPGVAFSYTYGFRLPDKEIAAVQEKHAAACEKLGVARCRVTGMRYERFGEGQVQARLDVALDPATARQFGRDAITAVEAIEGVLSSAVIGGTNADGAITLSQRRSAELAERIQRLEARLRASGLTQPELLTLQEQVNLLRATLARESQARADGEAQLALTPMSFAYEGMSAAAGPGLGNPFAGASSLLMHSTSTVLWFLLTLLAGGLPWLLLLFILVKAWRSGIGQRLLNLFPKPSDIQTA